MAGGSTTSFFGAAVGAIIAVAGSAAVLYYVTDDQRSQIQAQLAAIDSKLGQTTAKLEQANAAVAGMRKSAGLADTAKELGALNAEIKKTNAGLSDLQKTSSSDGIKDALKQIDGRIEKVSVAVGGLERAMSKSVQAFNDGKDEEKAHGMAFDNIQRDLADLKKSVAAQAVAQKQALDAAVQSVEKAQTNDRMTVAAKSDAEKAATPESRELVVVYVPQQAAPETTGAVPATPLSVRFEKIGAVNPHGQTAPIVANLKKIVADKHGCVISVAGYADTVGTDKVNLAVSRERAEAVATQLRSAFAGQNVEVKEVAWGERQLKVWTPDGRSEKANRRVDISVDCKG